MKSFKKNVQKFPFLILLLAIPLIFSCKTSYIPSTYKLDMVFVPGGSFFLGDIIHGENEDALPVHKVEVEGFYISAYETTFLQYDYFARQTGRPLPDDEGYGRKHRAVVNVTWDEAKAFCKYFGYRLPTEMEWEYAAREGGRPLLYSGTNSPDSLKFYAFTGDDDLIFSLPVGQKKPNALGLYDMSGNVFEWIGDFYQMYQYPDKYHLNEEDAVRIIRGGSFREEVFTTRTYHRAGTLRDIRDDDVGFRCAVSAEKYRR